MQLKDSSTTICVNAKCVWSAGSWCSAIAANTNPLSCMCYLMCMGINNSGRQSEFRNWMAVETGGKWVGAVRCVIKQLQDEQFYGWTNDGGSERAKALWLQIKSDGKTQAAQFKESERERGKYRESGQPKVYIYIFMYLYIYWQVALAICLHTIFAYQSSCGQLRPSSAKTTLANWWQLPTPTTLICPIRTATPKAYRQCQLAYRFVLSRLIKTFFIHLLGID